ncbi:MAG: class I SAM-dependent methyltransferase [Pseudomonadota bacterium]
MDFYLRVGTLAGSDKVYLDFGAGRAAWFEDDDNPLRHSMRLVKGRFKEVIATDIDPIVLENLSCDRAVLMQDNKVPLEDASVDVIVADYVLEHIPDPKAFEAEVRRLLKPGGMFCARTPHKASYVALLARLMDGPIEDFIMRFAQPDRKEEDIFPKHYKMNTLGSIKNVFADWEDSSFMARTDPAYYFGRKFIYYCFDVLHRIMPKAFSANIFVFLRKPN